MTSRPIHAASPFLARLASLLLLVLVPVSIAVAQTGPARAEPVKSFDIPAGEAVSTLKQAARQGGAEIMFVASVVRGVQTQAVKGQFTVGEALNRMLDGTSLHVLRDERTGALSIRREETEQKNVVDRPAARRTVPQLADGTMQLERFEVQSTRIDGLNNRSLLPAHEEAALPYQVISRAEIEQMGLMSTEQLFSTITQAVDYGTDSQSQVVFSSAVGGQSYSVASVDLGFGRDQTIVLVNGRRLGPGTSLSGPDISRIPLGSIERVEVLPAASAAIYGGGAVGGAINIILRKEYNAQELTTYFGTATHGGGTSYRVSYMDGRSLNGGRTKLTTIVDVEHSGGVRQGERDYLRRALDRYPPGSTDTVFGTFNVFETYMLPLLAGMPGTVSANGATPLGIPGNPTARYAMVPAGLTAEQATALTPASFNATAGAANLSGRHNRAWLIRPKTNYSVQFQLEHELLPQGRLSFYAEANAAFQESAISYPQSFNLTLPANHPFNPFRTGVTPGFVGRSVLVYVDLPDVDDPDTRQERNDARLTLGLKGKVRDNWEWSLDASGQYARLYADSNNPANYFQLLLNTVSRAGAAPLAERWAIWNPFQDHAAFPVSREHHDRYFVYNRQSSFYNRNSQIAARVLGELWELPAGPIRVSAGGDLRADQINSSNEIIDSLELRQAAAAVTTSKNRTLRSHTTTSAFVESTVPVFGKDWHPLGMHSFEIGASHRWSETNRGRNAAASTLAGNVWLTQDVMFRASITEGFTALTPEEVEDPLVQQNILLTLTDPLRGNVPRQVTIPTRISGGNPSLRVPSAHSLNYGLVLKPRFVPGLTVNVNYTHTKRVDSVATPTPANLLNFPHDYPGRVERAPLTPDDIALGYTGGAITLFDTSLANLAFRGLESFNYAITYQVPVPHEFGALTWRVNATHNNSQRSRALPSGVEINFAGTRNIPRWKGHSSLFWESGRWAVGVAAYYNDSYYDSTTMPTPAFPTAFGVDGRKIKHSLTFDLRGSHRFPAGEFGGRGWRSLVSGTTVSVGVRNLFDDMGPFVTDGNGFYSRFTNPMQRFVYFELKKSM